MRPTGEGGRTEPVVERRSRRPARRASPRSDPGRGRGDADCEPPAVDHHPIPSSPGRANDIPRPGPTGRKSIAVGASRRTRTRNDPSPEGAGVPGGSQPATLPPAIALRPRTLASNRNRSPATIEKPFKTLLHALHVPRLALPDNKNTPAQATQFPLVPLITSLVAFELRLPEHAVRARFRSSPSAAVAMPKAPVYENRDLASHKNEIGRAR